MPIRKAKLPLTTARLKREARKHPQWYIRRSDGTSIPRYPFFKSEIKPGAIVQNIRSRAYGVVCEIPGRGIFYYMRVVVGSLTKKGKPTVKIVGWSTSNVRLWNPRTEMRLF